jgi:hypothetical protein
MSNKYYLDWKEYDDVWEKTLYIWSDVAILIEETVGEILGGDSSLFLDHMDPWDSMEKKLRDKKIKERKIENLLEVIVNIKGEDKKFKKHLNNDKKITISDIQKVMDKYSKRSINVKAEIKNK